MFCYGESPLETYHYGTSNKYFNKILIQKTLHPSINPIFFTSTNFRPDANCPINIDSKSYEITKKNIEAKPNSRYIFDEAVGHVYQLMKNDSYPRYLRSEMYKEYLNGTKKKVSHHS